MDGAHAMGNISRGLRFSKLLKQQVGIVKTHKKPSNPKDDAISYLLHLADSSTPFANETQTCGDLKEFWRLHLNDLGCTNRSNRVYL